MSFFILPLVCLPYLPSRTNSYLGAVIMSIVFSNILVSSSTLVPTRPFLRPLSPPTLTVAPIQLIRNIFIAVVPLLSLLSPSKIKRHQRRRRRGENGRKRRRSLSYRIGFTFLTFLVRTLRNFRNRFWNDYCGCARIGMNWPSCGRRLNRALRRRRLLL